MLVISRQFTKDILLSTVFVLVILIALFAFFDLIGQMDEVGSNKYDLATAFLLTGLTLPSRAYEVAPLAVLLAAVYTMSRWASTSEFTVLRAAGLSPWRYQTEVRSTGDQSLSARGYVSGAWIRDVAKTENGESIDRYINIRSISASNRYATGAWRVFEFDDAGRLERMIRAESGLFQPGLGWTLSDVTLVTYPVMNDSRTDPNQTPVTSEKLSQFLFPSTITPEILGVMTTKPDRMGMVDLLSYIEHLTSVNQDADHFVAVFWSKVFYPLAVLVMLAISMPFAYMNARSGGVAIKIFLGVLIGIAFYALNNLFSYLSIFAAVPPAVMAAAPSVMMFILSGVMLWWVEKR